MNRKWVLTGAHDSALIMRYTVASLKKKQKIVAGMLGMTPAHVCCVLKAKRSLSLGAVAAIADVLGMPIPVLLVKAFFPSLRVPKNKRKKLKEIYRLVQGVFPNHCRE